MGAASDRRTFVRQVLIGAPAFAGAALVSTPAQAIVTGSRVPIATPDAGIDRVLHHLARVHNTIRHRQPTREDVRLVAADLRQLVAYRRDAGRDAEIAATLRTVVDATGRERFLTLQPDTARLHAGLAYYGVEGTLTLRPLSDEVKATTLDTLLRDGASAYYVDPIMMLESISAGLAGSPVMCALLDQALALLEAMAAFFCLGAQFTPALAPECFATTVVLAALKILELFSGC